MEFEKAPEWQRINYQRLVAYFEISELSDNKKSFLLWLSNFERESHDNFLSMITKLNQLPE